MLWPPACTEANAMARVVFTRVTSVAVACATPAAKLALPRCTVEPSFNSTACHEISFMSSGDPAMPRSNAMVVGARQLRAKHAGADVGTEANRSQARQHERPADVDGGAERRGRRQRGAGHRRNRAALHVDVRGVSELDDLPPDDVAARVVGPELKVGGGRQVAGDDVVAAVLELGGVRRHRPQARTPGSSTATAVTATFTVSADMVAVPRWTSTPEPNVATYHWMLIASGAPSLVDLSN